MNLTKDRKNKNFWTYFNLSAEDQKLIQQIQGDLPFSLTPFAVLARKIGWEEKKIIQRIRLLKNRGLIRRFGAILRHQKAGYLGNALIVWRVPEESLQEVIKKIVNFPEVSHCYLRPEFPDWPYNLYTMVHALDIKGCYKLAQKISQHVGLTEYQILPSKREFKKSSMRYFADD